MPTTISLFDSHAHVHYESYDADREDVLKRAKTAGVDRILEVALGPEPQRMERALQVATFSPDIFLAIGVHPHDSSKMKSDDLTRIASLLKNPKVVAVGEIGLDYHYDHSPRDIQRECFTQFLDLALELNLPVSIHSREAFEDTYRLLQERDIFRKVGGVLHCFTGDQAQAEAYLDLGAYISFSGMITFKKAEALRASASATPIERLLIETDAPFLAPEPYRGKRNEPAYVVRVAETIASLKGLAVRDVAVATSANACRLFRL